MSADQSFAPIYDSHARVLILGSLPGKRSIAEQGYYAHPRNAFWPIMAQLLGFEPNLPYLQRLEALKRSGIALWDVVAQAQRPGSLDSAIAKRGARYNDIAQLVSECPNLAAIIFNGVTAADLYRRAQSSWSVRCDDLATHQLPSTSPANAALSLQQKFEQWSAVLQPLVQNPHKQ